MRKQILWVCVVLFALSHQLMDAYLYHAVVLRKWLAAQERYHYFIGLGDYHFKQHEANKTQRELIEHLFAQQDPYGCKILTEDLSVPNKQGNFVCKGYYVNSRGGFLGGITQRLASFGLHVDNLEYRYARVCALGPVLNRHDGQPSAHAINVYDIAQEVERACQTVGAYDDGAVLNNWYQACIKQVDSKLHAYGFADNNMSMADYLKSQHIKTQQLKEMLTFDCMLLDAHIVHETMRNSDKDAVYALAGGSHIERASNMLQKVGYQPYMHIGPSYIKNSLEHCLQLDHNQPSNYRPKPLCDEQLRRLF